MSDFAQEMAEENAENERLIEISVLADSLTHWSDKSKDWDRNVSVVAKALEGDTSAMVVVIELAMRIAGLECAEANAGASI